MSIAINNDQQSFVTEEILNKNLGMGTQIKTARK
jgi:hypothetical protein